MSYFIILSASPRTVWRCFQHATLATMLLLRFNKLKDMSREIQLLKSYKYKVI